MKKYLVLVVLLSAISGFAKDKSKARMPNQTGGGTGDIGSVGILKTATHCDLDIEELKDNGDIGVRTLPLKLQTSGSYKKGDFKANHQSEIASRFKISAEVVQHKMPTDVFMVINTIEDSVTGISTTGGGFLEFDNKAKKNDIAKAILQFNKNNPKMDLPSGETIVVRSFHLTCEVSKDVK